MPTDIPPPPSVPDPLPDPEEIERHRMQVWERFHRRLDLKEDTWTQLTPLPLTSGRSSQQIVTSTHSVPTEWPVRGYVPTQGGRPLDRIFLDVVPDSRGGAHVRIRTHPYDSPQEAFYWMVCSRNGYPPDVAPALDDC